MPEPDLAQRVRAVLDAAVDDVVPIVAAGDPVLRRPARAYDGELPASLLDRLVQVMRATMHDAPGVGLAAPQIGLGIALAVLEDPGTSDPEVARVRERAPLPFRVVVNPRYTPVGTTRAAFYEGCLSVAGLAAVRRRWHSVRLHAQDAAGAPVDEVVSGWAARIVQHETDHLAGELYLDAAELRSLTDVRGSQQWTTEPRPTAAAEALGFDAY